MKTHARLVMATALAAAHISAVLQGCSDDSTKKLAKPAANDGGAVDSAGPSDAGTGSEAGVSAAGVGPCFGTGTRGGWCWQNRTPVSVTLYGGTAANANTAWAIGELGVVVKTTDGGASWRRVRRFDAEGGFFKSITAADANHVWAVGNTAIIKTSDGGLTWTSQQSGVADILNDVVANSPLVAWAVGVNAVLRTTDGGSTWQKLTTLAGPLYRLSAPTASVAYVTVQPDTVAKTEDGGLTWSSQKLAGLDGSLGKAISAPEPSVAWVVGDNGLVMRTTNGATWTATTKPLQAEAKPLSILALNATTAFVSFEDGSIARTIDGGASWSTFAGDRFSPTQSLFAADANTVWGVGAVGAIIKSMDAGATWSEQSRGPRLPLLSVAAVDKNTAWAAGFGCVIARTNDAGATWPVVHDESKFLTPAAPGNCEVSSVSALSAWAAGGFASRLIKVTDGGATSQQVLGGAVTTVTAVDANTVWTGGSTGFIAKTVDGGGVWSPQNAGTTRGVVKIYAADAQVAYAAFDDGSVRRTVDGGATWALSAGFNNQHMAIVPLDANRVVSVELKGVIRRSMDGGATFTSVPSGTTQDLNSATRATGTTLFAGGMFAILRSDDAGATWRSQPIPTFEAGIIQDISAVDADHVWAVSYNSGIMHTQDGGD